MVIEMYGVGGCCKRPLHDQGKVTKPFQRALFLRLLSCCCIKGPGANATFNGVSAKLWIIRPMIINSNTSSATQSRDPAAF